MSSEINNEMKPNGSGRLANLSITVSGNEIRRACTKPNSKPIIKLCRCLFLIRHFINGYSSALCHLQPKALRIIFVLGFQNQKHCIKLICDYVTALQLSPEKPNQPFFH